MSTLYDRIRKRREDLGMSQTELANKLKYGDRSTIAKIEKGVNDLTQSKIEAFAAALHTTPAYLMGWTDDWYDYDTDEDNRFDSIPSAQFNALMERYHNDLEEVWHAWERIEEDTYNGAMAEVIEFPPQQGERSMAQNEDEEDMLLLARHMEPLPEEDREMLKAQFRSTIDVYLKRKTQGPSGMEDK